MEERAAEHDEPGSGEDAEEDVGGTAVAEVLVGDVQCGVGRIEEQQQVAAPVPLGGVDTLEFVKVYKRKMESRRTEIM